MKTKITVLYYLRKSKANAHGQMPVYQRITINKQRFDVSSGLYVEENKWSSEASKMKGSTEEARIINSQLDMMRATVYETEKRLFMNQVLQIPVEEGIVFRPEDYKYSSAPDYAGEKGLLNGICIFQYFKL